MLFALPVIAILISGEEFPLSSSLLTSFVATAAFTLSAAAAKGEFQLVSAYDNVLGTSLAISIRAHDESSAKNAEQIALKELDRLSAVFSTYDEDSEISKWLSQASKPVVISRELMRVLERCDYWRNQSHGAFHPGVGLATAVWQAAEKRGDPPSGEELMSIVNKLREPLWRLDIEHRIAVRQTDAPITLNAIATGAILDEMAGLVLRQPNIEAVMIDIGGDAIVAGNMEQSFSVKRPHDAAVNAKPVTTVRIRNRAITTSGGRYRGFNIGGRRYSHIIDPRTGAPVRQDISATVIANSAEDADALATILCLLPPAEGIALVESQPDAACLLMYADGKTQTSVRWPKSSSSPVHFTVFSNQDASEKQQGEQQSTDTPAADSPEKPSWNGGMQLTIDFEIHRSSEQRYRRPYVAVWIEDKDGYPVKTLVLWAQTEAPGPRWIPDLRQWYRSDKVRKLAEESDLIARVSEPTRKPGKYSVVWDGLDNDNVLVEQGEYTVHIEAAREHGTYQIAKKTFDFSNAPFEHELEDGKELTSIRLAYAKHKDTEEVKR